jgi:2-polyprenyl-3-methyl-5-hydroxy-6-metoxy-1,4-benzoquinol methylase
MSELDMTAVEEHYGRLFGKVDGAFTCVLAYLGDKLGLYRALAEGGPTSSEELAHRVGLNERWVREWLRQQAAAGVLTHDDGRFGLSPEAAAIYADEDSPVFGAGIFDSVIGLLGTIEGLEESFRTGVGAPYDSFGLGTARGIERTFKPFFRTRLVSDVLPALDGVAAKLRSGAKVADVGCGAAVATVEMAKAFPESEFHAFDNSRFALARAEANKRESGVDNLTVHDTTHARLAEDGSFDLITTFDCIHDMTHPAETIRAIRRSLKPDGTWFVADIRGHGSFSENLENQPFAGMLYGFSVTCCMRAALAVGDGAGLGTLGFPEAVARRMSAEAGFTRFTKHDFQNPLNDYYEIRP